MGIRGEEKELKSNRLRLVDYLVEFFSRAADERACLANAHDSCKSVKRVIRVCGVIRVIRVIRVIGVKEECARGHIP
jgi:hypothetical protein